jgi:DNA repair exonuclease SbcCD ATPase subunit
MRRSLFLIVTPFLVATAALAQTAPTDSQTLQALLAEVRQLRHDLQTTTATAQRAQIALYRLQRQDEAVGRAAQKLSDARSKLTEVESEKHKKLIEIQGAKAAASHLDTPGAQTHFEEVVLPGLKSQLETLEKEEQQARAHEAEAAEQLREEQVKLDGLNDLLDRLNTALEEAGRK